MKPAHLGDIFLKVYNNIFQERQKLPKTDPINYVFKIILNSTYGLSNEPNSYLYDPLFTMSITLNGQLLILKLVEMLTLVVPEIVIYQENTDGISIGYSPDKKQVINDICKEWEKLTKLNLEHAFYKQMIIVDVNNYIAETTDKKIKRKGLFEYQMDYHKNPSFLITSKALEAYFVYGKDYKDFILNHENIYDFFGAVKSKSDFDINLYKIDHLFDRNKLIVEDEAKFLKDNGWIEYYGNSYIKKEWIDNQKPYDRMACSKDEAISSIKHSIYFSGLIKEKQQKICRYYISNKGGKLIKDFKDKRQHSVHAKNVCSVINTVNDTNVKNYDINYKFYINEVKKIIDSINNPLMEQKNLFNL